MLALLEAEIIDYNARNASWINIDPAQAGGQKGRGCIEHILALRLLIDYCVCKKQKLFILCVDFQKANDRVPHHKLMESLKSQGCGKVMLSAIIALYKCTWYVLRSAIIPASLGVRQGAPTSCLLFIFYINKLVQM